MATYRILAIIPTIAVLPAGGAPVVADEDEVWFAFDEVQSFPDDMLAHSDGQCVIDLSVAIVNDVFPTTTFDTVSSQDYIHPRFAADFLGAFAYYDGFLVMSPQALTTTTTFRGIGGTSNTTPFMWCKVGQGDERAIVCHEWGHALTAYLSVTTGEYTNFPSCGVGEPAMHCAEPLGYGSDIGDEWLHAFFTGNVSGGTGINATGWAVETPTERGNKVLPRLNMHPSPWGIIGPLHLGVPGD